MTCLACPRVYFACPKECFHCPNGVLAESIGRDLPPLSTHGLVPTEAEDGYYRKKIAEGRGRWEGQMAVSFTVVDYHDQSFDVDALVEDVIPAKLGEKDAVKVLRARCIYRTQWRRTVEHHLFLEALVVLSA